MSRTHRERLLSNGFLQEVIKGWYIPSRPDEVKGESTAWYASFWRFCGRLPRRRVSAELVPFTGTIAFASCRELDRSPPARGAVAQAREQCHQTPAWDLPVRASHALPDLADRAEKAGLRLFSVESALIEASPQYFSYIMRPMPRGCLAMIRDASDLLADCWTAGTARSPDAWPEPSATADAAASRTTS